MKSDRRIKGTKGCPIKSERGTALLELMIATPLLALLFFGIVELGKALEHYQAIGMLAREGAQIARRECLEFDAANVPSIDTACLQTYVNAATTAVPAVELVFSLFDIDGDLLEQFSYPVDAVDKTKWDESRFDSDVVSMAELAEAMQDADVGPFLIQPELAGAVVICEVFFYAAPLTRLGLVSGDYYDVAIF